eukprot:3049635-Pyramimonas_sp.AAC.1
MLRRRVRGEGGSRFQVRAMCAPEGPGPWGGQPGGTIESSWLTPIPIPAPPLAFVPLPAPLSSCPQSSCLEGQRRAP